MHEFEKREGTSVLGYRGCGFYVNYVKYVNLYVNLTILIRRYDSALAVTAA